jgi:hypothetical protein
MEAKGMESNSVVVEVTTAERAAGKVGMRRALDLTGYLHPDSIRKHPDIRSEGWGMWNLDDCLAVGAKRIASGAFRPAVAPAPTAAEG